MSATGEPTLAEVARRVGVPAATLRRWVRDELVALPEGVWSGPAVAQARIVARLRQRGHTIAEIRRAADTGRLAFGYLEDLFAGEGERISLDGGRGGDGPRARADRADPLGARASASSSARASGATTCAC